MHDGNDDDLASVGIDSIHNAIGEPMEATTTIGCVQRLVGIGVFENIRHAMTKFLDEFDAQSRAL